MEVDHSTELAKAEGAWASTLSGTPSWLSPSERPRLWGGLGAALGVPELSELSMQEEGAS